MSRRRRHNAFTTIELLVAISILVILAGMVFVGFKVVGTGGKTRSTQAALESAKSMLAEIDASGGMTQVKAIYQSVFPASTYLATGGTNAPALPNSFSGSPPDPLPAPTANVSEDMYSASNTQRYTSNAVIRTQAVMARLVSSPVNRSILSQIPAERLLSKPPTTDVKYNNAAPNGAPNPPILVDAWSNPIIYVPPSGLSGVTVAGDANRIVTSHRVRGPYGGSESLDPGASGFWASAGPDGDFSKGDDNLYSFE